MLNPTFLRSGLFKPEQYPVLAAMPYGNGRIATDHAPPCADNLPLLITDPEIRVNLYAVFRYGDRLCGHLAATASATKYLELSPWHLTRWTAFETLRLASPNLQDSATLGSVHAYRLQRHRSMHQPTAS
jgi:hypothetical protein